MELNGLHEYSHHCNLNLLTLFEEHASEVPEKARLLLDHILNAHEIWNFRILKRNDHHSPWDRLKPSTLRDIENENYHTSLSILKNEELQKLIEYTNTKGQTFTNSVFDMLFHVVNHATYHRAQIATEFRNAGLTPLVTDYIFYKRDLKL